MSRLQSMLKTTPFLAVCLTALTALSTNQARADEVFEGAITVHAAELKAGTIYMVEATAKDFVPNVSITPGYIPFMPRSFNSKEFKGFFSPRDTRTHLFAVTPSLFSRMPTGKLDYKLKITEVPLAAKPILEEKTSLVDADPIYNNPKLFGNRNCKFKEYKLKAEKGKFYIIEMIRSERNMDPYLYLEDADGKIIARDDDGAGDLNSRLVYQATETGTYRVIATTLSPATGEFTITIRGQVK